MADGGHQAELDDSDCEELTPAEVLERLEEAWHNEKVAPELLPSRPELVDCILGELQRQEEEARKCSKNDVRSVLLKLEGDRIRYMLSSYLRTRLEKIEQHVVHVLQEHDPDSRNPLLSDEELSFAKQFADNMDELMHDLVLRHMPSNMQKLDPAQAAVKPNMSSYVFLMVKEDVPRVIIDDDEEPVELQRGTQHLMPYAAVASLVKKGKVALL